jgi:uncharacterized protein
MVKYRSTLPATIAVTAGIVSVLSVTTSTAANDLRLLNAVRSRDKEAVRTLVKQRVDVNALQGDGTTALSWAAHWDDLDVADLLIGAGANANMANEYGVTPVWEACNNASAAMVEKVLKAGANPNAMLRAGETSLMRCARTGNPDAVKLLLVRGADINAKEPTRGQTALMWALEESHPAVAAILIEGGADVHAKSKAGFTPLSFAARRGDLASARLMLEKGADPNEAAPGGLNALLMATDSGREEFAIFLLEHGANSNSVDRDGASALHIAMRSGMSLLHGVARDPSYADSLDYLFRPPMTRLVKELLDHGANPNARIAKGSRKTPARPSDRPKLGLAGASPFMLAAAAGDVEVMRMLLTKGADPKLTTEDGTTPLMAAAGVGFSDNMTKDGEARGLAASKLLIELGADPNASNKWGTTPLHGAAYTGANEIVRLLVSKGADLHATDQYGQTPLSIAEGDPNYLGDDFERRSNPKTAELIRQLGGDPLATGPGAASVGGVTSVIAGPK